jgi:mannose-1-phosphate guanylyltransferase
MRALLLAAGLGTRLAPLTRTTPKCLVPFGTTTLLDVWLDSLVDAGVERIRVNLHHHPDLVADRIDRSPHRDRVESAFEQELLGTAGTLRRNRDFFEGADGMLIHADNLCLADLGAFLMAHEERPTGCDLTLMAFRTDFPAECGICEIDERSVLRTFREKDPNAAGNLASAAVFVLTPTVFEALEQERDFSSEVLPRYEGRALVWEADGYVQDIGTPERYAEAREVYRRFRG